MRSDIYKEVIDFDIDIEEELKILKHYYNGYRFSEEVEKYVYNSDMILYYLDILKDLL